MMGGSNLLSVCRLIVRSRSSGHPAVRAALCFSSIMKSTETIPVPLVLFEPQVVSKFAAVKKRKSNIDPPPPLYKYPINLGLQHFFPW